MAMMRQSALMHLWTTRETTLALNRLYRQLSCYPPKATQHSRSKSAAGMRLGLKVFIWGACLVSAFAVLLARDGPPLMHVGFLVTPGGYPRTRVLGFSCSGSTLTCMRCQMCCSKGGFVEHLSQLLVTRWMFNFSTLRWSRTCRQTHSHHTL